ncbi:MAG: pseudouridine synthase, partial [Planctomycetota bacterium]
RPAGPGRPARNPRTERTARPDRAGRPERATDRRSFSERGDRPVRPGASQRPGTSRPGPARSADRPRRPRPTSAVTADSSAAGERLQKILAAAGLGSRRECEELITTGRVEVDRQIVTELGVRVNPDTQMIRVDGTALRSSRRHYFVLNKPPGVVSTNYDQDGRPRVIDLIQSDSRLYPVGRLDRTSEGLIIVTNDGELANGLTHPRYGVEKTYLAIVAGHPDNRTLDKLRYGVRLAEGVAKAASVKVKRGHPRTTELLIVLDEGRNRQIRRMLAQVGHKVLVLRRVAIGPLKLGELPVGAHRRLEAAEVQLLFAAIAERKSTVKKRPKPPGGRIPRLEPRVRPDRSGRMERTERSERTERGGRMERPERTGRMERADRSDRPRTATDSASRTPAKGSRLSARTGKSAPRPNKFSQRPPKSSQPPTKPARFVSQDWDDDDDSFPLPTNDTRRPATQRGSILPYDLEDDEQ